MRSSIACVAKTWQARYLYLCTHRDVQLMYKILLEREEAVAAAGPAGGEGPANGDEAEEPLEAGEDAKAAGEEEAGEDGDPERAAQAVAAAAAHAARLLPEPVGPPPYTTLITARLDLRLPRGP